LDQKFAALMERLHPAHLKLMSRAPVTGGAIQDFRTGDLIATRGIYLFTENGEHLYVGRSNRLLARCKIIWRPNKTERETSSDHVAEASKALPRVGSKLASLIDLLRRPEGAPIDVLVNATGWLPRTTRAAITGIRKRGYSVVLERSVEGASAYRLSDPQESEAATAVSRTLEEPKASRRRREAKAKAAA
jgi:hypothetical protein